MKHLLEIKDNEQVISSLVLVIEELRSRKFAMLEEVKTTEGYRNKGYGHLIIQLAIATAKEQQCDTIELCFNPKDKLAVMLYEKCGFKEDGNIRSKIVLNDIKKTGRW